MYSKKVLKLSGLIRTINEDNEIEYMGTDRQRDKAEELQNAEDNFIENQIDEMIDTPEFSGLHSLINNNNNK